MAIESPSALYKELAASKKAAREYRNAKNHLVPILDAISFGPKQVGYSIHWQGPFRMDISKYYERGDEYTFGDQVEGATGSERVVTERLVATAGHRSRWGVEPKVSPPFNLKLAAVCGLTENGPLPILPFRVYQSGIDKKPHSR